MAKTDTKSVEFPNGSGSWHIGEWDELALADFIKEHLHDDVATLRLKKWKPLPFPVEFAITQIAVRKKLSLKLPSLYNDIIAPSELAAEQCSSEATAKYKQHLVVGETLCDLTGGMGIDILFMAENMSHAVYVEQNASYCDIAQRNFNTLHRKNITVVNKDCVEYINHTNEIFDTIYIDPARRDNQNGRVYSLRECFPDVVSILQPIISKCKRLIIKASTMADITQIRKELGESVHADIHIVSVRNECKEILIVIDANKQDDEAVICAMIDKNGETVTCKFNHDIEGNLTYRLAENVPSYIYEPDAALLKSGMYKSISEQYGLSKLHKNSHLYTSDSYCRHFPGRGFEVIEVLPFASKICRGMAKRYPMCNVSTRNFPMSSSQLRNKLGVKDGGDIYLFATTNAHDTHILVICKKVEG